ncbi:MAG: tRNA (adenosine(37)-N6)-dimethylallyltransferase MiaA [Peptococcaceae bacterium]|nr:tRNA (adenosine(37)-N6)-dimethylallyltransferase MiaA [Peptococcaceae bacterium]
MYSKDGKPPLLAIVGPTATGKTEISVHAARRLGAEIISADSMLIYRHMNIGTAKPSPEEMGGVPHHMIDVADPGETFNVALYSQHVKTILHDIIKRKKLPMLVGGTGLYVRAVIDGYNFSEAGTDQELRAGLMQECAVRGKAALHRKLREVDPEAALRLHVNDVKRVVRALEVYYLTGKTLSGSAGRENRPSYNLLMYGLTMDRKELYARIEKRIDNMMSAGLVEEVRGLLARGYSPHLTSMQGLGYKEIILYLNGKLTLAEAVALLKRNTRRFAKRQLTWFRRDERIKWIDVGKKGVEEVAAEIAAGAEGVFKAASKS